MLPGLRLRQVREKLGLTYRDVERISYELAARRGRPEFVLHISRLADIENHDVVPSLHKLYTLAVVYHLSPLDLFSWYEVPLEECFEEGVNFPSRRRTRLLRRRRLRFRYGLIPDLTPDGRIFYRGWWRNGVILRAR